GFAPVAKTASDKQYLCVNDVAGTPRELTDRNGVIAWSARFTAFGEVQAYGVAKVDCPVRFQGQWHDEETGLYYNRCRYYEPQVGRYISRDPIGFLGGMNLYSYPTNPVTWVDPLGLDTSSDAEILGSNLTNIARDPRPDDRYRAHHIVMSNSTDP